MNHNQNADELPEEVKKAIYEVVDSQNDSPTQEGDYHVIWPDGTPGVCHYYIDQQSDGGLDADWASEILAWIRPVSHPVHNAGEVGLFTGRRIDSDQWVTGHYFHWKRYGKILHMIGEGVQNGSVNAFQVEACTIRPAYTISLNNIGEVGNQIKCLKGAHNHNLFVSHMGVCNECGGTTLAHAPAEYETIQTNAGEVEERMRGAIEANIDAVAGSHGNVYMDVPKTAIACAQICHDYAAGLRTEKSALMEKVAQSFAVWIATRGWRFTVFTDYDRLWANDEYDDCYTTSELFALYQQSTSTPTDQQSKPSDDEQM